MIKLRDAGKVVVKHVPTELNPADLFTKVLSRQEFEKHRRVVLNLPAAEGVMKQVYERRALESKKEGPSDCSGKDPKKKKVGFKA